jgi:uncharacterized protein
MPKTVQVKPQPLRTCIATGVKKPKSEMIRLVRLPAGNVVVDPTGKLRGRGANLDMNEAAFDLAVKKNAIDRALKLEKKLSQAELAQLKQDFLEAIQIRNFRHGNKPVVVRIERDKLVPGIL